MTVSVPQLFGLVDAVTRVLQIDEDSDIGLGGLCVYIVIILVVLLVLAVLLYLYQSLTAKNRLPRKQYCHHCGRNVIGISSCCHEPVREEYLRYICPGCGKPAKVLCADCRHPID